MSRNTGLIDLSQPIMITMESFSHLKDAKLASDDGSIIEATLINCDTMSRNRTFYPLEDVIASMGHSFFKERIDQKILLGEAEHPTNDSDKELPSLKRLMRVEPSRVSHRIDSYWADGNNIKGIVQWCGPFGPMYQDLVSRCGSNAAFSIRAYTPVHVIKEDSLGKYAVKKHLMYITTFDCVTRPGLTNSRIMHPETYANITKNDKITINSITPDTKKVSNEIFNEICYTNVIEEIRNLSSSQEGLEVAAQIFGIDFKNGKMEITGKNKLTVISEEGLRLDLPLNHTVLSRII